MIRPRAITRLITTSMAGVRSVARVPAPERFATSQPVAAPEADVERDGDAENDEDAEPESPLPLVAGVGDVLPEVAGDRGRDGDDRRPGGELLHDHVHPGVGQRHVRLED